MLGRGGRGEVYLAHDQRLKREVALKILPLEYSQDKTRLARFHREATAAAALNHPNICTIYEVGESEGKTCICMECVEGRTLREYISGRPLAAEQAPGIGIQVADALEQARQKNIVHRDIKSQNIILTPRGQAKILDLGLAKNLPLETDLRICLESGFLWPRRRGCSELFGMRLTRFCFCSLA